MPFLVLATLRQNKRVIRYLLSQGVENVNVRDEASGNTPLHYAIMMVDGEEEDGKGRKELTALLALPPFLPPSLLPSLPPSLLPSLSVPIVTPSSSLAYFLTSSPPLFPLSGRGRRMRALASLLRRFRRHLPPHAWLGRKGRREDTGEEGTEEERQMDMVTFLLYLGANPTAKNKKGNTPLMELARFQAHGRARWEGGREGGKRDKLLNFFLSLEGQGATTRSYYSVPPPLPLGQPQCLSVLLPATPWRTLFLPPALHAARGREGATGHARDARAHAGGV